MQICVTMTEQEMNDFLQYRKEKAARTGLRTRLNELAKKVLWAVGPDEEQKGKFIVIDQDHAEDLMEMAAMYAE